MDQKQLSDLIVQENEEREREMVREAQRLIRAIASKRSQIAQCESEIAELQASLKKLNVTKIDPISILGN